MDIIALYDSIREADLPTPFMQYSPEHYNSM